MQIAFYYAWGPSASYVDKLISVFTAGKFSHTELVFSDGVSFGISGRSGGARFKNIDLIKEKWNLMELNISKEEELKIRRKANYLEYRNIQYDYMGAFTCGVLPFCIQKNKKLFCSEATTDLIRNTDVYSFLRKGCKYSPMKLYRSIQSNNH